MLYLRTLLAIPLLLTVGTVGAQKQIPDTPPIAVESQETKDQSRPDDAAKIIYGKVVGLTDGDTIIVLQDKIPYKIRLEGIDAPETTQNYGTQSRRALGKKVFQKEVQVKWHKKDQYGRVLGNVFLKGRWINKELVEEGWAWHYRRYSKSEELAQAEKKARADKVGLWQDQTAIPPWEYRRPSQTKTSQTGNRQTTVYVTKTGKKYHRDGCRYLRSSRIPMPLDQAAAHYEPCSVCNPPRPETRHAESRAPPTTDDDKEEIVYVTKTGTKYHRAGCRYLKKSCIPMPLSQAAVRYSPCSVCNPPIPKEKREYGKSSSQLSNPSPSASGSSGGRVHVKGYYRKDGTYVRPHTRRAPRKH